MTLHFITLLESDAWGGSEHLWLETLHASLRRGDKVRLSCPATMKNVPPIVELQAKTDLSIVYRRPQNDRLKRLVSKFNPNWYASEFDLDRADLTVISQPNTFGVPSFPALQNGLLRTTKPYVLLCHWNADFGGHPAHLETQRQLFLKARFVLFVSQKNLQTAERQLATHLPNARVVRNPVNLPNPAYLPFPRPLEPLQLANVARLDCRYKGQDLLLEALATPTWRERAWQLNLYGSGEHEAYLKSLIQFYELEEKVFLKGFQKVEAIWRANHVLVMPSLSEGTPLSLVEAMLCGRAAVVSPVAGMPEWIQDGNNGFIMGGLQSSDIAAALERLWQQRAQLEALGRQARQDALTLYDPTPGETLLQFLTPHSER